MKFKQFSPTGGMFLSSHGKPGILMVFLIPQKSYLSICLSFECILATSKISPNMDDFEYILAILEVYISKISPTMVDDFKYILAILEV